MGLSELRLSRRELGEIGLAATGLLLTGCGSRSQPTPTRRPASTPPQQLEPSPSLKTGPEIKRPAVICNPALATLARGDSETFPHGAVYNDTDFIFLFRPAVMDQIVLDPRLNVGLDPQLAYAIFITDNINASQALTMSNAGAIQNKVRGCEGRNLFEYSVSIPMPNILNMVRKPNIPLSGLEISQELSVRTIEALVNTVSRDQGLSQARNTLDLRERGIVTSRAELPLEVLQLPSNLK